MPKRAHIVGLVGKSESPIAAEIARQLADHIVGLGLELRAEEAMARKIDRPGFSPEAIQASELCVVVGGDGTLLRAAKLLGASEVPIFGVNAGRLGFLTEIRPERALPLLSQVLAGDYIADPRAKLRARLLRGQQVLLEEDVVNDVVINRGAFARMVEMRTRIDGAQVGVYRADGLIVATPTGSTAYNLSSNGPILMPGMDGLVVSPICPHTLTQRPLVVSGRAKISIEVTVAQGEILLSLDGQSTAPLQAGDHVELERAEVRTLLIRNPEVDFFVILREKLRWNESV